MKNQQTTIENQQLRLLAGCTWQFDNRSDNCHWK